MGHADRVRGRFGPWSSALLAPRSCGQPGGPVMSGATPQRPPRPIDPEGRSGMEQLIGTFASAMGNTVAWLAEHGILFAVFAVLWLAFGTALVWSQGSLDQAWESIRELPLPMQLVAWVLFLPVMAGPW